MSELTYTLHRGYEIINAPIEGLILAPSNSLSLPVCQAHDLFHGQLTSLNGELKKIYYGPI